MHTLGSLENRTVKRCQEILATDRLSVQTPCQSATGATDNTIQKDINLSRRNVTSVVRSVIFERHADRRLANSHRQRHCKSCKATKTPIDRTGQDCTECPKETTGSQSP